MKKLTYLLLFALATFAATAVNAQGFKMPAASSTQTITQEFGLGQVTITYSRPNLKGRKMLGVQEPFGEVWRTGANSATTIKFTDDVTLEGNKVAAGTYAFFTIPDAKEWTIILNKTVKQWGAYSYKADSDVLRFKVKPMVLKEPIETFSIQFANVNPTTAELHLMWEHTAVAIHLTTDVDTRVLAGIDEAMKNPKKPYFAAAQYYYTNNHDMAKALEWISEVEKTQPKSPAVKVWKARIQLKAGDKKGALATAEEGARLAHEAKDGEYERLNATVAAQAKS
jgi:hypothetical protein